MNWGLFLGCKVRHNSGFEFVLNHIAPCEIADSGDELFLYPKEYKGLTQSFFSMDTCKPILRPLSSITEEEKDELRNICLILAPDFNDMGCIERVYMDKMSTVWIDIPFTEWFAGARELIWFMSNGFDVGQCKPEECILEG